MIDHADKFVFNRDFLICPSDMVGNVQIPRQSDWCPVFATHHVEPLQLDTEDLRWPLYLVLLGGGHLLMTLLALVHVLTLAQVLSPEVTRQSNVNMVSLSVK